MNDSDSIEYRIAFGIAMAVIILLLFIALVYFCCCKKKNALEIKYAIGKKLGSGGFGAVYEAQRR